MSLESHLDALHLYAYEHPQFVDGKRVAHTDASLIAFWSKKRTHPSRKCGCGGCRTKSVDHLCPSSNEAGATWLWMSV